MKHYINKNNEIFGFELDGSQDHLIMEDMREISLEEIEALNVAKDDELKQTLEYKIIQADNYLKSTDWVEIYILKHDLKIELIPEASSKWEIISKRTEYINFLKENKK